MAGISWSDDFLLTGSSPFFAGGLWRGAHHEKPDTPGGIAVELCPDRRLRRQKSGQAGAERSGQKSRPFAICILNTEEDALHPPQIGEKESVLLSRV